MSNPVARIIEYVGSRPGRQVITWCPGCEAMHPFTIEAPPGPEGDRLNSGITWEWDGNLERPTFSPSLLCKPSVHLCEGEHEVNVCEGGDCGQTVHSLGAYIDGKIVMKNLPEDAERIRLHVGPCPRDPAWGPCHSFLRGGRWQFLSDSAHKLAGKTVDMVPLPDWLMARDD